MAAGCVIATVWVMACSGDKAKERTIDKTSLVGRQYSPKPTNATPAQTVAPDGKGTPEPTVTPAPSVIAGPAVEAEPSAPPERRVARVRKPVPDIVVADDAVANQLAADKAAADKAAADERAANKVAADNLAAERRAADKRAADERAADKRAADKLAADARAADKLAADKSVADRRIPPERRVAEPGGQRTVLFRTTPPGARIRLTSSAGAILEPTRANPALFSVPAGVYSWEVELAGYLPDRSGEKNRVDLLSKGADTLEVTLTPAVDRVSRMESANAAFNEDRCPQAIAIYQSIERPAEMGTDVGRTWLASRGRLAQCQRKLRQFDPAIATYNQILAAEPFQWNAKYELGGTRCEKKEFKQGADVLRELAGPYLNNVPQDRRPAVQALARYGRAICQLKDYQSQAQPDNHPELRDPAVRLFDEFIFAADKALKDGVPAEIKNMLTRALNDATTKRAELRGS